MPNRMMPKTASSTTASKPVPSRSNTPTMTAPATPTRARHPPSTPTCCGATILPLSPVAKSSRRSQSPLAPPSPPWPTARSTSGCWKTAMLTLIRSTPPWSPMSRPRRIPSTMNYLPSTSRPLHSTVVPPSQATPATVNDEFSPVDIPPTEVQGAFFVGASAKLLGAQDRPARVDTNNSGENSWFFCHPDITAVIDNLADAEYHQTNDETPAFPGSFMVRATGIPVQ